MEGTKSVLDWKQRDQHSSGGFAIEIGEAKETVKTLTSNFAIHENLIALMEKSLSSPRPTKAEP